LQAIFLSAHSAVNPFSSVNGSIFLIQDMRYLRRGAHPGLNWRAIGSRLAEASRTGAGEGAQMNEAVDLTDSYYRSLTRRIVLIIVVVSVIPLLLISGAIRYFFQVSYQKKVLGHLEVLIRKHRQNIDTFLSEKLANIRYLAESYSYDQLSDETFLKERLRHLQDVYGRSFADLGVVNEQGIQVAYAGPFKLKEADYSQAPWFRRALQADTNISDVIPCLRGLPHFIVTLRHGRNRDEPCAGASPGACLCDGDAASLDESDQ